MCEAFARGLIDYSKYDLTSSNVIRIENIVISKIEKEYHSQLLTMRYFNHSIKQTILTPGDQGIKFHKEQVNAATTLYNVMGNLLLPWLEWNTDQINPNSSRIKEAEDLRKRWENTFGSLSDPTVQNQLNKLEEANKHLNEPVF